jgi:uncharacterized protein YaaR (DUF327 family)
MTKAKTKSKAKKPRTSEAKKRKAKAKKSKAVDRQQLTRLIEDIIDEGANTAEEINRAVLDLPIKILVKLGLDDPAKADVRRIKNASIGTIYTIIHDINHQVADLASDLLKKRGVKKRKASKKK